MYTKDLSANVTLYGQEQCNYCGAATAQMIRNAYPNLADRLFYTQLAIWNTIQVNNSTAATDVAQGWATDPHGLKACLQALNNPAGVHWSEFADASRDVVLFDMLYWMNRRNFPSGVLINQGGHWVVIAGFTTDVEPIAGSAPLLQSIIVYDPEPHFIGTVTTMNAAQWYGGPWNGSIIYAGTWQNQYVAVVEPPIEKGEARVELVARTGRRLLSPEQALESAQRWIKDLGLAEQPRYKLLGAEDAVALEPVLVRDEPARKGQSKRQERVPYYYIVPFGFRGEVDSRGTPMTRVAVLVNAYTGHFEEVTAFGQPVRYLTQQEAIDVVAAAMRGDRPRPQEADVILMFQPSDITHIRTWPFWRVRVDDRFVYVDQLGKLYGKLLPSVPGD